MKKYCYAIMLASFAVGTAGAAETEPSALKRARDGATLVVQGTTSVVKAGAEMVGHGAHALYDTARRTRLTTKAEYIFDNEKSFTGESKQEEKIALMTPALTELVQSIHGKPDNRLLNAQALMLFDIAKHNGIYNEVSEQLDSDTKATLEELIRKSAPPTRTVSTQTEQLDTQLPLAQ